MLKIYPIEASKLQVIEEDKNWPFTLVNKKESKMSSRVFKRKNGSGKIKNYYEYRDTAMQKNVPIYPEWIRPLSYCK